MSQYLPNIHQIEKKMISSNWQDGLIDIYIALMFIPFIIFIKTGWHLSAFLPVLFFPILYPTLKWVKRTVILPRSGSVKPGASFKKRMSKLVLIQVVAVAVLVIVVFLTVTRNSLYVVFGLFAAGLVAGTAAGAWLLNLPRVLLYGVLLAASIPVDTVMSDRAGWIPLSLIPMAVMIGIGTYLLVKFLKENPLPEMGDYRGS